MLETKHLGKAISDHLASFVPGSGQALIPMLWSPKESGSGTSTPLADVSNGASHELLQSGAPYAGEHSRAPSMTAMHTPTGSPPAESCPASLLLDAVRAAQTPLALADPSETGPTLTLVNDAFARLFDCDPAALRGRLLTSLETADDAQPADGPRQQVIVRPNGGRVHVVVSTAPVLGADGHAICLLCSLLETNGRIDREAWARDADLLAQVARAASALQLDLSGAQTDPR
jgi:PAS domain-containing protein